ncbi:site-specific DNA-methyltransferase [Tenacibaculum finnmarkense]|uniref:site-specific DNA-methyltransferase n=2 Tax=Tenacibaculum finnmarkense TaxID=2781243 RepID=UPI00187B3BAC|nr:site-specific DNA-methyltransferase [Tenacibaculum finnmarkense]MBE7634113.1 site-specific DNA-methyltransferase [Tenacibaculum finnmarkense genomovar ulcerans]MBE7697629.1 site-specific DNA-methyltransferase [Tenacibaculum finnmarkense genomovar ulcerans]MCD8422284.1 site-specific DNA-methyltransferase [Tenacibaculum finnmarkense genomovar ulcerans]MCD8427056.1 site-specific DNA-methyltransferase [Tenacibaculum finnmarkense genomovar finnmarkense]MCG8210956.1 site-specific DNA-methyltransf
MEHIKNGDKLSMSKDLLQENIEKLKDLFPELITENKIDFNVFRDVFGDEVEEEDEYYRFTWAGKAQARREAHKPSTGTLRPVKEDSVEWDTTENVYIEGDNLEVLKLLQKSYAGKVKMIYIDPPYNTGKDFVYKDNYKDNLKNYQEVTGQVDSEGNKLSTNSDSDGRYHSNWLNMMYPRLRLARNLLKEDGVIFMSIDDHELENLKKISDDVFGEDNRLANLIWDTNHSAQAGVFKVYHQYILVYAKKAEKISTPKSLDNELFVAGAMKKESSRHPKSKFSFPKGTKFEAEEGKELEDIWGDAEKVRLCEGRMICEEGKLKEDIVLEASWTQANQMKEFFYGDKDSLVDSRGQKVVNFFFNSSGKIKIVKKRSVETPQTTQRFGTQGSISKKLADLFNTDESPFDSPKPVDMISTFSTWFTDENDIVLDFFGGSSTTAHGVYSANCLQQINRNFILIQLPEDVNDNLEAVKLGFKKITEIGKERIRRAGKKIAEENPEKAKDLDLGFKVFKLDSSNIKSWDGNPENLQEELFDAVSNIKTDRTEEDVLYEILLKYGLDLTLPIEEKIIEGKTVFNVGFGALFICLGDNLTNKVAEGIGAWKEELQPEICRVIFKDTGFTDVEKTNSIQTLKRFGITEIKSI